MKRELRQKDEGRRQKAAGQPLPTSSFILQPSSFCLLCAMLAGPFLARGAGAEDQPSVVLSRAFDEPVSIRVGAEVKWLETMSEGVAEATKRDRPIVLVFPEAVTNRHEWFHDSYARVYAVASDAVFVRMLPPQMLSIPAGATAETRQLIATAFQKLQKEYTTLVAKYGVAMLPTVLFTSPDGDTVLRAWPRTMETTVTGYFKNLETDFAGYQKTRAAFHEALKAKGLPTLIKGELPPASPASPGPSEFGSAVRWHDRMKSALEEAARSDKPILLAMMGGDRERHEWFYGLTGRKTVNASGVVPVRILPPQDIYISPDLPGDRRQVYTEVKTRLHAEYTALTTKYGVTAIPTILFLSPDGEQVLAKHSRAMETAVWDYFKTLSADFENYKKLRAMLKTVQQEKPGPNK